MRPALRMRVRDSGNCSGSASKAPSCRPVLNGELDVPRMTRSGMGLPEWHFSPSSRYKDDRIGRTALAFRGAVVGARLQKGYARTSAMVSEARKNPFDSTTIGIVVLLLLAMVLVPKMLFSKGKMSGDAAPDFSVNMVVNAEQLGSADSTKATLSQFRGKAVVIDFWATWCAPCRAEAPIINKLAARYKGKDVVVLGVNTDDAAKAKLFAEERKLTFPIGFDSDDSAQRAYHVDSLPTLVVVSKTGKVVAVRMGVTSESDLEALVEEALAI
jgi:cytochrome c biogenesis protein CcmG, thiol:disulfide interchange protein DsbE